MKRRAARLVGGALLLVVVAVRDPSTARYRRAPGHRLPPAGSAAEWTSIPKPSSGLGGRPHFHALVSNRDALLLVGSHPERTEGSRASIWRSWDGLVWNDTTHPSALGTVNAIAIDGDIALAMGGIGPRRRADFVWGSADGGRTWTTVANGTGLFGAPAPRWADPVSAD